MKKAYVYILKDKKEAFYIGSTSNIVNRLKQHTDRKDVDSTTYRMKDPQVVLVQEYPSIELARKIERKLKKLKRRDYIEKIREGYIKIIV